MHILIGVIDKLDFDWVIAGIIHWEIWLTSTFSDSLGTY